MGATESQAAKEQKEKEAPRACMSCAPAEKGTDNDLKDYTSRPEYKAEFAKLDINGDGYITLREFRVWVKSQLAAQVDEARKGAKAMGMGAMASMFTVETIESMSVQLTGHTPTQLGMIGLDANGDDRISYREWCLAKEIQRKQGSPAGSAAGEAGSPMAAPTAAPTGEPLTPAEEEHKRKVEARRAALGAAAAPL